MRSLCDAILVECNYQAWVKTWRFSRDVSRFSYVELNRKLIKGYEKHYGDYLYKRLFV